MVSSVSAAPERPRREVRTAGTVLLPHTPASVAVARRRITADLAAAGVPEASVGDAVLVLSELLSNAIRHARPLPGAIVEVAWRLEPGAIEVAVSDGGAPTRPAPTHAALSALGGRGLDIVEYLSAAWGIQTTEPGLTVWAVLAAPPGPAPQPPWPSDWAVNGVARRNQAARR